MDWLKENTKSKTTGGFAEQGLKNEEEGSEFVPSSEILSSFPDEESVAEKKAEIRQEMELVREEREEKDNAVADQLIAIHGAKVKFNGHLGEFKVLNDVPTTQDKLTGTTIENQVTNFTFFDGFVLNSLATWQDVATVNYQDNEALIKKSTLPGVGKMPGNTPPESGKIEFLNSGQVHMPESLVTEGAPLLDYIQKQECFCTKEFTVEEIQNFVKAMRATEKIKTTLLFSEENCPIEKDAVGYIRLCNELNATMKKYNINSCIRKIHFLAQTYHESSRFGTTLEYSSGKRYNPGKHNEAKKMEHTIDGDGPRYKGRGIIQLTWRKTQKAYFSYKLSQDKNQFQGKEIAELFNRKPLYKEKYIYYKDKLD